MNTAVYDYRNQLKAGSMTLYAWKVYEGDIEMPNALGTLVSNPNHDQAVTLTITFNRYQQSSTIMFPAKDKIVSFAKEISLPDDVSSKLFFCHLQKKFNYQMM